MRIGMGLAITQPRRAGSGGVASSSLLTGVTAYWKLDEASGVRNDSHGANHLADNNTVTSTAGKIVNAAAFVAANSEYLSIADNAALSMGNFDFTIAAWAYLDDLTAARSIVAKDRFSDLNQREYAVDYSSSANRFRFYVAPFGSTGDPPIVLTGTSSGALVTATWYLIVAWHDAAGNTINIQVNNGTVDSLAHSTGVFDGTTQFNIGARDNGRSQFWSGRIDEVGIWKRKLTPAERTELWNGGDGKTYPFS